MPTHSQCQIHALSRAAIALALAMPAIPAMAIPVGGFDVISTFNFIDARQTNTASIAAGTRIGFGLNVTPPVGTTVTATQGAATINVPFLFSPALPNQFFTSISLANNPTLTGAWTFNLTNAGVNGGTTAHVNTAPLGSTTPPPFANNVLLTPNATDPTRPTISWVRPAGYTPSNQTITIWDKTLRTPNNASTLIFQSGIGATVNSFIIPQNLLNNTDQYTFAVQLDTSSGGALIGRSRAFVDFNVQSTVPVFLPVVGVDNNPNDNLGAPFLFNFAVAAGTPVNIDPLVATGYEYRIGAGDPLFASVTLPNIGDPDGYFVCLWNGSSYDACSTHLNAGQKFDFVGGTDQFRVIGINEGLGVDPANPTAFITTLTSLTDGQFTGSQTAITVEAVPEPASAALLLTALLGLAGLRRHGTPRSRK